MAALASPGETDRARSSQPQTELENGVYLLGESPQPQQIGSSYMVFEVRDNRVVGAFYQPRSQFDCFYGSPEDGRLSLTVINSYTQDTHAYGIPIDDRSLVADANGNSGSSPVDLAGFHEIGSLSPTDRRVLATCKADLGERQSPIQR